MDITELKKTALNIRKQIINLTADKGVGHTGGSLSETDILTTLYFEIMNVDPEYPKMENRDRFILSKGHSTPGFYSTLAERGFFPKKNLNEFDEIGSMLQGHPCMHKTPGVDMSSGSLGQGVSVGIGMSLAKEKFGLDFKTFVLMGDGEQAEGQIWEAAMYAGANKVKDLIGIVDYNKVQLCGTVSDILEVGPLNEKWKAFGWQVLECDGHNLQELVSYLNKAKELSDNGPVVLIAHTVKGKGVSFMENKFQWHGKAPNEEERQKALRELGSNQ
ncbi:MAG TPA: transketolase [Victivallales bacterium]|nr:transketolase [Victivallales bacterium]